jgi:hypothetical protein
MKKSIRCIDPRCNHGKGNLVCVFGRDCIFLHHRNPEGNYWEKITYRIPGIVLDFISSAFIQSLHNKDRMGGSDPILIGNKIFVKCSNWKCQSWNELSVAIPGINIDFSDSAAIREDLPVGYYLDIEPAAVVIA